MRRSFLFLLLLALGFAPAFTRTLYWDKIEVDITINPDSTLYVEERMDYVFDGKWRGGLRSISRFGLEDITVTGLSEDGRPYTYGSTALHHYIVTKTSGAVHIKWRARNDNDPPFHNTRKSFTLEYLVTGAVRHHADHDEVYWKGIFEERAGVVKEGIVRIHYPEALGKENMRGNFFTSAGQAFFYPTDDRTHEFRAEDIRPYVPFEIQVYLPKGMVEERFYARAFLWKVGPLAPYVFPLLTFIFMFTLYWHKGRDYPAYEMVHVTTSPPTDLPPAVAGVLVDESAGIKEIMATLVDLAHRGWLELEEYAADTFSITRLDNGKDEKELEDFEMMLLTALDLTRPGRKIYLDDLKNKFYVHISKLRGLIFRQAVHRGFFPKNFKTAVALWAVLGAFLMAAAGATLIIGAPFSYLSVGIGISGLVVLLFARAMPRKTVRGSLAKRKWKAYYKYLKEISAFKEDVKAAGSIFEKNLPYAVAFGLEEKWANKFRYTNAHSPHWYHPHSSSSKSGGVSSLTSLPSLQAMSTSLNTMLNTASTTFVSAPGGSSSGGGGGGGGGGSGGGGGGGW